ncbi:MAG: hypothetical protein HYX63_07365 [Gammaproteobacteria bacterium]|nr:hypothetical protein [Gammaproteobacteria bacterium]
MTRLATPLEQHGFSRYSRSEEIAEFLRCLVTEGSGVRVAALGHSALGHPLLALNLASTRPAALHPRALRVLMVGSQHGASEAAGAEALLMLARAILLGDLAPLREAIEFMLIPNANPDGRELDSSKNANAININRDFVLLSQSESVALDTVVAKFAPDVILDAHESAILKRKTLGREGYVTEFEAQFDVGNSPAIPAALRAYAEDELLPALIGAVSARGLPTQRYIREISSTTQPITNGGLSIRRFRNKAALHGTLSLLLETPMEPQADPHPTYRNIAVRTDKQLLCMREFLQVIHARHAAIVPLIDTQRATNALEPWPLRSEYVLDTADPVITIPLRRRDNAERVALTFRNHRAVATHHTIELPAEYIVTAHTAPVAALLARHRSPFTVVNTAIRLRVKARRFGRGRTVHEGFMVLDETERERQVEPGALRVTLRPGGRLLPMLLDPRSSSSIFRYPPFARLIESSSEFFILEVDGKESIIRSESG